jgi:hypothetical protein
MNPSNPYSTATPKTEGMAVFSLVLGVLSFFCSIFTGIPAIICGHIARARVANSNGALAGGGLAIVGLILGYLSVLFAIVLIVLVVGVGMQLPGLQQWAAAPAIQTMSPRIAAACNQYRAEKGQFPAATVISGEQVNAEELFAALAAKDANGNPYYDPSGSGIHVNGTPRDPWNEVLQVAIDLNGDGKVNLEGTTVDGSVIVWSKGANKQNEFGGGDDIKSW